MLKNLLKKLKNINLNNLKLPWEANILNVKKMPQKFSQNVR